MSPQILDGSAGRRRATARALAALLATYLTFLAGPAPAAEGDHDHGTAPVPSGEDHGEDEHDDHRDDEDDHGDLHLDAATRTEFGIEVAAVGPGVLEQVLALPGEVRPNADRLAHIVPRYSGIVTEVRATIGDQVAKGDVLAVVESDESLVPFEVTTLISGTVIEKHVALGEAASRDRDTFLIADLSTVWIELTVYQRDLDLVRPGQTVRLFIGHDRVAGIDADFVVDYVSPVLDPHTRTATARVVAGNASGAWRPGMFVTGEVVVATEDVQVAVPRTALFTLDDEMVVFVETDHGFEPREVEIGRRGSVSVEVVAGLDAGTPVVVSGGFTLKAELGKDSFGHGHAH